MSDTEDTGENGDLGLGRGLQPGSLDPPKIDSEGDNNFSRLMRIPACHTVSSQSSQSRKSADTQTSPSKHSLPKMTLKWLSRQKSDTKATESTSEWPTFAEVPLGTSLRQQRELYAKHLKDLFPELQEHQSYTPSLSSNGNGRL